MSAGRLGLASTAPGEALNQARVGLILSMFGEDVVSEQGPRNYRHT